MWNDYANAEMQLPAGCLRPDQRCKKKEKYIQTIFSLIWSFYTRKYNLPMQWFPRQFHAFQWRCPENINHSIWLFKLKISFDCRNVLDVFLLCEKLSSTMLTLHDAPVRHWIFSIQRPFQLECRSLYLKELFLLQWLGYVRLSREAINQTKAERWNEPPPTGTSKI